MIHLTECPRDAMQGIHDFIPTETKAMFLNQLLKVGFDVLDFGSFVSPKAIPQMKDTAEVLERLELENSGTKLLAIIANLRGAQDAAQFGEINFLGFPFSVSEEFQLRNTKATREDAIQRIADIQDVAHKNDKELIIYLSMGFGNPYGEEWSPEIVAYWAQRLSKLGINRFALSDTIGSAQPDVIMSLFRELVSDHPASTWGVHLHTTPSDWEAKTAAAYEAGCRRFDGAIKGYGGCPMAKDELTGNMPTELMIDYLEKQEPLKIDKEALEHAIQLASKIFP